VGGPLALARSRRVDAELAFGARLRGERVDVLAAFADAAQGLAEAGATREAVEAGLRACGLARRAGRLDVAARHLAAAQTIAGGAEDVEQQLGLGLEALALAAVAGGRESFAAACAALARLPGPEALAAAGRLELAWRYDQLLAAIVPAGDRRRRALALRMRGSWDALMGKVPLLERAAVRTALYAEAGERAPLRGASEAGPREDSEDVGPGARELRAASEAGPREDSEDVGPGAREEHDMSDTITQDDEPRAGLADVLGDLSEAPAEAPRGGERHERLIRIYRRLAREDDLRRLLAQVVDAVMDLCDAERGAVVVVVGGERLEVARELAGSAGVAFSRSIIERVLEQGAPVLSVDAVADDRFDGSRSISHLNLRSVLAVPLLHRGEAIGAVYVDHRLRRGAWGEADLVLVEEFAELAALAIAHARTLAEQRAQAEALAAQGRELARLLEERELEVRGLREAARTPERRSYRGMIGGTAAMQAVFRLIDRLADSDVPVVIFGESGTGKELVARAIHEASERRPNAFIKVNCAAIPRELIESELFGHERGAFTGATGQKRGLFELAHGGTLFLDEIGDMDLNAQAKVLRVLQSGELMRVGGEKPIKVDVRVLAATHRNLKEQVQAGEFREDLYFRLAVVPIVVPPLREREGDVALLCRHYLDIGCRENGISPKRIAQAAQAALDAHNWPGNVRELRNVMERMAILSDGDIELEDVPQDIRGDAGEESGTGDALVQFGEGVVPPGMSLKAFRDSVERAFILQRLSEHGWNVSKTSEALDVERTHLHKKMKLLGIARGGG